MASFSIRYWKRFKELLYRLGFKYVKLEGDWNGKCIYQNEKGSTVLVEFTDVQQWGERQVPRIVSVELSGQINETVSTVLDFIVG